MPQSSWTASQEKRVLAWFREHGSLRYRTYRTIADETGQEEKTVRAIATYHDGRSFLLAIGVNGIKAVEDIDEAEATTVGLEIQLHSLQERVARRRAFARSLEPSTPHS
jgi:hypothetical protein